MPQIRKNSFKEAGILVARPKGGRVYYSKGIFSGAFQSLEKEFAMNNIHFDGLFRMKTLGFYAPSSLPSFSPAA